MTIARSVIAAGLLVLATAVDAPAQPAADEAAFVKDLVEAVNSKSLEARKALLHPKSVTCARPETAALRDELMNEQATRQTVPPTYRYKLLPTAPDKPPLFADKLDYTVKPTHLVQIDYETGPNRGATLILQAIHEGGVWREVFPCPKPETVAEARAARAARPQQEARIKGLVDGMPAGLRAEVQKHLQAGRKIDAIKHYREATGADLSTAKAVVDRMVP